MKLEDFMLSEISQKQWANTTCLLLDEDLESPNPQEAEGGSQDRGWRSPCLVQMEKFRGRAAVMVSRHCERDGTELYTSRRPTRLFCVTYIYHNKSKRKYLLERVFLLRVLFKLPPVTTAPSQV